MRPFDRLRRARKRSEARHDRRRDRENQDRLSAGIPLDPRQIVR